MLTNNCISCRHLGIYFFMLLMVDFIVQGQTMLAEIYRYCSSYPIESKKVPVTSFTHCFFFSSHFEVCCDLSLLLRHHALVLLYVKDYVWNKKKIVIFYLNLSLIIPKRVFLFYFFGKL